MKRIAALMLTVMMIAGTAAAAQAETPLRMMYDSFAELLFDTSNVTLTGHAEFSLAGERFKTADARYIQDGANSLWDWKLLTPRQDGTERPGGYTVIANDEKVYVMEVYYPGVYKTGTTGKSDTILRKSVQLNLLRDFLRIMADQSDTLLGGDAVQVARNDDSGMEVRVQVGKDVPEIVNTALNMTVQFAAKRYFETDYDLISEQYMGKIDNYITVTQGILGATSYMALREADVTLKRDAEGKLESAAGSVAIELNTENDGVRILDITFRLDVSDRGSSRVDTFRPEDWGVEPANGASFPN